MSQPNYCPRAGILLDMDRKLLVTHHAPDLDAIGAVWMLKRFDSQHFAAAKIAFVNPGDSITLENAERLGHQLHEVTHVDTGFGEFDHHQPKRGHERICATSLTFDHASKIHPELKDDQALKWLVEFITDIDHFGEIHWPDASHYRYLTMIHELIKGLEHIDLHDDDSQLHFGMDCLDSLYASLTVRIKAEEIIKTDGQEIELPAGKAMGVETSNDDTIKVAQKQGYVLVVRKDPKLGNIRIKVRPDSELELKELHTKILETDKKGTWFYHPSGKMLINGSRKHKDQAPSPLSLGEVISFIKEIYGK